jgi:tight adherence protein B
MPLLLTTFGVVFGLVLLAATVGFKFFETKRRKNVTGMLRAIVSDSEAITTTAILRDVAKRGSPMERLAKRLSLTANAKAMIQQAGMDWTSAKLLTVMMGAACGGIAAGMAIPLGMGPAINGLALGAVFGAAPYLAVRKKRNKRLAAAEEQFADALDFLARSMRAGHAFSISLEMLGQELADPLGVEFRTLSHELNLGAPIDVALKNLCERIPLLDMRFFSSSVMLQKQTGGNLSEILNRLSYVIRERFRLKGQVKAASSHGRFTAMILTGLPLVTTMALLAVAPNYLLGMFNDPDGKKMIVGAIVAQVIGRIAITKIVNIKV